jgi:putative endopeptidase
MAIALATLKKRMEKECLTEEARKQTYRDFFTAYAISWRQMDRKKKILFSLLEDVHSPSSIRVNLVVNQFQEWYDTFNVDTSDKYYIPPEKRISIF